MRKGLPLFLVILLAGARSAAGDEQGPPPRQLHFAITVCEGDPLGSAREGTIDILSRPMVLTLENQTFFLAVGQEIPVPEGAEPAQAGIRIEGKAAIIEDGKVRKVRLDITVAHTAAGDAKGDQFVVHTESTRRIMVIPLDEVVRFRLGKGRADKQTWVEIKVKQMGP